MYNFNYSPSVEGYSTDDWKTLSGSPAISGGKLRISSAEVIQYADIKGGRHNFSINIPTPDGSTDKEFGLMSKDTGEKITFKVDGTDLVCTVTDEAGTTSSTIAWDSNWEGSVVDFVIDFSFNGTTFKIADKTIAVLDTNLPTGALSLYLKNGIADNMDVTSIKSEGVETYI